MRWRGLFYIVAILFLLPAFRYNEGCNCCDGANYIFGVMEYVPKIDDPPSEKPAIGNPPSYFSWMDYNGDWTTPARYQGACGSCWDFAAVGALESVINIEEGIADFATIDYSLKTIGGFRMGPFELMDFTGIDICYLVNEVLKKELPRELKHTTPYSLKATVRANRLGRKTGAGWYDYKK